MLIRVCQDDVALLVEAGKVPHQDTAILDLDLRKQATLATAGRRRGAADPVRNCRGPELSISAIVPCSAFLAAQPPLLCAQNAVAEEQHLHRPAKHPLPVLMRFPYREGSENATTAP